MSNRGFVYCLQDTKELICRIGITKNDDFNRPKGQIGYYPRKLLMTIVECDDYSKTEKVLHGLFGDKRLNGDWFKITSFDFVEAIIGIAFCYRILAPSIFEYLNTLLEYGYKQSHLKKMINDSDKYHTGCKNKDCYIKDAKGLVFFHDIEKYEQIKPVYYLEVQ